MKTVKVAVFKTTEGLDQALQNALNAAECTKHIKGTVLIKPNICSKEYIVGAVTNPQLLFHLVSFLRDKVEEVIVGESNGYNYNCDEAFTQTGIEEIVKKAGGKTINLSKDRIAEVQNPNALWLKKISLPKTLVEADSVVSVPVMKTHEFTLYGGAIKNLFGCIPNNRRIFLHPHLNEVFHDLIIILQPKFAVMDATVAMEGNGPNRGIQVPMNLVFASSNLLTIDKVATEIMGINWEEISHLRFIDQNLRQGEVKAKIIGENIEPLKRQFLQPYADLAVRSQRWVYKHYLLTRLCFGTPIFDALQAGLKVYRGISRAVKGKAWVEKYWQDSN